MKTLDFHSHLGQSIFGYSQDLDTLMRSLEQNQIDLAVVCPVQPMNYHLPPENDRVAQAAQKYPDRLLGFCRVDPRRPDARIELKRCIQELGLHGLFLNPWEETCPINAACVKILMAEVQALEIPVLIAGGHVRVSMPGQLANLAQSFPEIPMVVTSGGQINISGIMLQEATQLLQEHPNLYLETSGIYREDFIEDLVPVIGSERMIFGSNSPEYALELEVLRPRMAHLAPEHRANILFHSAAKLLKLDPA